MEYCFSSSLDYAFLHIDAPSVDFTARDQLFTVESAILAAVDLLRFVVFFSFKRLYLPWLLGDLSMLSCPWPLVLLMVCYCSSVKAFAMPLSTKLTAKGKCSPHVVH